MPFTTSHPAIVLPLKQLFPRQVSLTGLAAGAMSPDLVYFLMADTTYRGFGHSWSGLFVFCLPAGALFGIVFHRLFKFNAIANLPWLLERRLTGLADSRFVLNGVGAWLIYLASVLVGALSHFGWDSFTHPTGEMARALPVLLRDVEVFGITRPICRWLQHMSSLWGGLYVLWFLFRSKSMPAPTRDRPLRQPSAKFLFWLGGGLAAAAAAVIMVWFYNGLYGWHLESGHNLTLATSTAGLATWAGFFYFVCAYTAISRAVAAGLRIGLRRRPRPRRQFSKD